MKKVKIDILESSYLPEYKTPQSAGCDLKHIGKEPIELLPGQRAIINTGECMAIPDGYEGQVRGRSGLNFNEGLIVPTGTVDADYRGEIKVCIYNLSGEPYTIQPNESVAQLVISPVVQAEWNVVKELNDTKRGKNGFGSTGK